MLGREGASSGVSRTRRAATKRRSLALAAAHARTCETGIFKRPVRGESQKEENNGLESAQLNGIPEQPGWTEIYVVPVSGT
jgi:hypothetical protein